MQKERIKEEQTQNEKIERAKKEQEELLLNQAIQKSQAEKNALTKKIDLNNAFKQTPEGIAYTDTIEQTDTIAQTTIHTPSVCTPENEDFPQTAGENDNVYATEEKEYKLLKDITKLAEDENLVKRTIDICTLIKDNDEFYTLPSLTKKAANNKELENQISLYKKAVKKTLSKKHYSGAIVADLQKYLESEKFISFFYENNSEEAKSLKDVIDNIINIQTIYNPLASFSYDNLTPEEKPTKVKEAQNRMQKFFALMIQSATSLDHHKYMLPLLKSIPLLIDQNTPHEILKKILETYNKAIFVSEHLFKILENIKNNKDEYLYVIKEALIYWISSLHIEDYPFYIQNSDERFEKSLEMIRLLNTLIPQARNIDGKNMEDNLKKENKKIYKIIQVHIAPEIVGAGSLASQFVNKDTPSLLQIKRIHECSPYPGTKVYMQILIDLIEGSFDEKNATNSLVRLFFSINDTEYIKIIWKNIKKTLKTYKKQTNAESIKTKLNTVLKLQASKTNKPCLTLE